MLNERVGFFFSLFQMSDQPAEGTFTDADRSTVTSTTASSVQYHILTYEPDSSPLKHILQDILVHLHVLTKEFVYNNR